MRLSPPFLRLNRRRLLYPPTAAAVLAYFLFFTWKSLFLYFDQDDMYNLYMGWSKPLGDVAGANLFFWNGFSRPLGAIFYRAIFAMAGFDPLPFHIAALTICVFNLALCFWFTRMLTGSERTAALATLIFAFQTRLMEVWFRTAVIYDVLCFTFVYLAAGIYIAARREGRDLSTGRFAAILACFVCALDAKEMAVCLPVFLAAYEAIFNRSKLRARACVTIGILCLMTIPYAVGKLHGPDAISNNPDYTPVYSYARFATTWGVYLGHLFVRHTDLRGWVSMAIPAALLGIALAARSRKLVFAWTIIFFGLLPVSFVPPRGAFVMYISYLGWALYGAVVLVSLQDLATRTRPEYRTALACAVFALVGWRYGKFNLHDQRADPRPWLYDGPKAVRAMASQMLRMHRDFPPHAQILLEDDGFTTEEWTPMFILRLLYNDRDLVVDRGKMPVHGNRHDYVFSYEYGRYREVPSPR